MGCDVEKEACLKEVSDFTDIIGGNGPWQRRIFLFFLLAAIPAAWQNLVMAFMAPNIKYWCAEPTEYTNMTTHRSIHDFIPAESSEIEEEMPSKCLMYQIYNISDEYLDENINVTYHLLNVSSTKINSSININVSPCQNWEFDETDYTNTIVSQWNLVCSRDWMISLTKSVYMAGFLISVILMGHLGDKIGRKPVLTASLIIAVVSGIICAFSISFVMFTVCRFFIAFGISGLFNTGFVLLMEVVGPETRSFYGLAIEFGWAAGFVMLAGMGWLIRDWNWLQLTITVPCFGFMVMWWLLPESPRWLMTQGKFDKAQKILCKASKINGKKTQDIDGALKKLWAKNQKDVNARSQSSNLFDLLRTPGLRQKTLNIYFCWFVNAFIYYGLSYNTNELAGDPFLNFAISGAVEFPAYFISIFAIKYLGRRKPLMITLVAGGVSCLLTLPLPEDFAWGRMPLAMFGKFCITASFGIIFVYTAEIFPTVARNIGIGSSSMCGRIGSVLAPFVKELGHATHPAAPLTCFGLLSILSGLLILLLPETNNCTIPDTLEEAAKFGKKPQQNVAEETEDFHKPCVIHDSSNDINEKVKPSSPVPKSRSDGKKLPDLLEEPSVVDEVTEDEQEHSSNQSELQLVEDSMTCKTVEDPSQEAVELNESVNNDERDQNAQNVLQDPPDDTSQQTPL